MVKSLVLLGIVMFLVPFVLGMLYTRFVEDEKNNILMNIVAGYSIAFGLFEVIALPLVFLQKSLSLLIGIYGGCILVLVVISLFFNGKRIFKIGKETFASIRSFTLMIWAELVLIVMQLMVYVRYQYSNADDSYFVAAATTAISTNSIFQYSPETGSLFDVQPVRYVLSPWYVLTAVISKVTDTHPAILTHMVYMLVFLLLAYAVYALIGRILFEKDMERCGYFLVLLSVIHIFSAYSLRTTGIVLMIRLWQGKAFLAGVLLPLVVYVMLRIYFFEGKRADYILLLCLMSVCCMASTMGVMLGAICAGLFGVLTALKKRHVKWLLYTVACCLPNVICGMLYLIIQ